MIFISNTTNTPPVGAISLILHSKPIFPTGDKQSNLETIQNKSPGADAFPVRFSPTSFSFFSSDRATSGIAHELIRGGRTTVPYELFLRREKGSNDAKIVLSLAGECHTAKEVA